MLPKASSVAYPAAVLFASVNAHFTVTPAARASSASGLSQYIAPEYAGFGIEPSNLFSFTGGQEENTFTTQLMQNLADYSGKAGHVRLGGNTQDYFLYNDSMNEFIVKDNPRPAGQGAVPSDMYEIGPRYFEAINRFTNGTPVTFGLNLAYYQADYLERITAMAQAAVSKLTNVDLVSMEIGNEPDLYLGNRFRNGTWTGQSYTQEWTTRAEAIYARVLQPAGLPVDFFEGPCSASTIGTTFEVAQLVDNGIQAPSKAQGTGSAPYLRAWNQHDYFHYLGVSAGAITVSRLMNLDNTETQFAYWATQVGIALQAGLPYHLREMASVGPVGLAGVSDTLGAALWTLHFFLYAAALNISSVQMHMTDNSFAAPWQPVARRDDDSNNITPRNVRPSYCAFAAMAQLVGAGNGTAQVAVLPNDGVPGPYKSNVRMYAGYGHGGLTSVVIINAMQANASEGNKPSLAVSLSLEEFKGQTLYLSYLTADGADSTSGTTWNGMQYSDDDGRPSSTDQPVQAVVVGDDGIAVVDVRDSQAVIAHLGSLLGSNQVMPNGTTFRPTATRGAPTTTATGGGSSATATPTPSNPDSSASRSGEGDLLGTWLVLGLCIILAWSWP